MSFQFTRVLSCRETDHMKFLAILVFVLISTALANEPVKLELTAIENEPVIKRAMGVLELAIKRLKWEVEFLEMPGKRAIDTANRGIVDGDVGRIRTTGERFSNLVIVDVPLTSFSIVIYGKQSGPRVNSLEELRDQRIGYLRGVQIFDQYTEGFERYQVKNPEQLLEMLKANRIDYAIHSRMRGRPELKAKFQEAGFVEVGSLEKSREIYLFLHKKNQHLVAPLEAALRELKASGEIERYHQGLFDHHE